MSLAARCALVVSWAAYALGGCVLDPDGGSESENRPPVIVDQAPAQAVGYEDGSLSFMLHAFDPDGDFLDVVGVSSADFNSVTRSVVGGVSHLEAWIWVTPERDYNGTGRVSVSVSDGDAVTDNTLYYRIDPVNDPPVARDDFFAVPVNAPLELSAASLLVNDDDATDLYATCASDQCLEMYPPAYGLTADRVDAATAGTVALVDGTIRFVPPPDFVGVALFEYTITDGTETADAAVHVTVGGLNATPVATDDVVRLWETDRDIYQSLLVSNDRDLDGHALAVIAVGNPTGGSVELRDGIITVDPDNDREMSFDYTITDGTSTSIARVTVEIAYWI
jgi:hypothetical protein